VSKSFFQAASEGKNILFALENDHRMPAGATKNQPPNTIRSFYRTKSTGLGIALPRPWPKLA
jgi:hypothetical protein